RFTSKHWRPLTTRFWIPDGFFGGAGDALDLTAVGKSVAGGEHLFINTYLIGVTTFASAGRSTYARYAAELAANESEHRVLGQTLAGASPPNYLGFAEFEFDRVSQIAAAAKSAGFGFGEQGTAAGRFYDLPGPPLAPKFRSARTDRDRPNATQARPRGAEAPSAGTRRPTVRAESLP